MGLNTSEPVTSVAPADVALPPIADPVISNLEKKVSDLQQSTLSPAPDVDSTDISKYFEQFGLGMTLPTTETPVTTNTQQVAAEPAPVIPPAESVVKTEDLQVPVPVASAEATSAPELAPEEKLKQLWEDIGEYLKKTKKVAV